MFHLTVTLFAVAIFKSDINMNKNFVYIIKKIKIILKIKF